MSLQFKKDEDAIFIGQEEEGAMKGALTLFIVGQPPLLELYKAMKRLDKIWSYEYYGIYLGAGGSIHKTISMEVLSKMLASVDGLRLQRIVLESTQLHELYLDYTKVTHASSIPIKEWIVPIVFNDYVMPSKLQEEFRGVLNASDVQFISKIYYKNIVQLTPLKACYFADFENNKGHFQTDRLWWSSQREVR